MRETTRRISSSCQECGNDVSMLANHCPQCGSTKPFRGLTYPTALVNDLEDEQRENVKKLGGNVELTSDPKNNKTAIIAYSVMAVFFIIAWLLGEFD